MVKKLLSCPAMIIRVYLFIELLVGGRTGLNCHFVLFVATPNQHTARSVLISVATVDQDMFKVGDIEYLKSCLCARA